MTLANAYMQIVYLHQAINFTKSKLKVAITKLKLLIDRVILVLDLDSLPIKLYF